MAGLTKENDVKHTKLPWIAGKVAQVALALALSLGGCDLDNGGQSAEQIRHGCQSMFPGNSEYNACLHGVLFANCASPQVQDFKPCQVYIQKMEGIAHD